MWWPFGKKADKDTLAGVTRVRVNGLAFTIRRLNPLLDFSPANMPMVFSTFQSRRQKPADADGPEAAARSQRDMQAVVEAGLVEPKLVPLGKGDQRGKEDGLTVDDVFRDQDTALKLYVEILAHSMNRFRGVKGAYFLVRNRYKLFTALRQSTASAPATSPSPQGSAA